jgi:glycerol kinase
MDRSARFIVFDQFANIIAQHQIEFPQYYPEPGYHHRYLPDTAPELILSVDGTNMMQKRSWSAVIHVLLKLARNLNQRDIARKISK